MAIFVQRIKAVYFYCQTVTTGSEEYCQCGHSGVCVEEDSMLYIARPVHYLKELFYVKADLSGHIEKPWLHGNQAG